ncbi:MAG: hypothetical protein GF398_03320 [Chitinivibrionales bacterium]|nr:hypothetical protein [Chitinivibrionales bacterium]
MRWLFAFSLLFICNQQICSAPSAPQLVNRYFASLDSLMRAISLDKATRTSQLRTADRLMADIVGNHPAIEQLIRTNSRGKVINEIIDGRIAAHTYRRVGNQKWYRYIRRSGVPYYSYLKRRKTGKYYLFWARPTKYEGRFGGSVSAKIGLQKCFEQIALRYDVKFMIALESGTLFTNLENPANEKLTNALLSIPGFEELTISYVPQPADPEPAQSPRTAAAMAPMPKTQGEDQSDNTTIIWFLLGIALLGVAALGVYYLINKMNQLREKRLNQGEFL